MRAATRKECPDRALHGKLRFLDTLWGAPDIRLALRAVGLDIRVLIRRIYEPFACLLKSLCSARSGPVRFNNITFRRLEPRAQGARSLRKPEGDSSRVQPIKPARTKRHGPSSELRIPAGGSPSSTTRPRLSHGLGPLGPFVTKWTGRVCGSFGVKAYG